MSVAAAAIAGATLLAARVPAAPARENAAVSVVASVGARPSRLTAAHQVAQRREHQLGAHPLWRDLSWQKRVHRVGVFTKRLLRTMVSASATSAAIAPSAAGFQGNLTVIDGQDADAIALRRNGDCSLTLLSGTYTLSVTDPTIAVTSQTPGFGQILHDAAGLSTTAGGFPQGCNDATLGIGSRRGAYLGRSGQGPHLFAGSGYNYDAETNVLYHGAVDASALTLEAFDNDGSLPGIGAIAAGDLDGDELADIVGVDFYDSASIQVWLAADDGTLNGPTTHSIPGAGDRASAAVIEDVDGDGAPDVVVATRDSQSGQQYVSVLLGEGDGDLGAPNTLSVPNPTVPSGSFGITQIVNLIAADIRGNGRPDLVASNGLVMLNDGDGNFEVGDWAFPPLSSTSSFGPNLVSAHLDDDDHLDVAVSEGVNVHLWAGDGEGAFTRGKAYASINNVGYLSASDLDGDGNIDLYVGLGNGGFFGGDQFEVDQAYALMGNGDGSFKGAPATPFIYTGTNLGDLDGDDRVDAIGLNADRSFTAYLGGAGGSFAAAGTLDITPLSLFGLQYNPNDINSFGMADIDGDGNDDLLFIVRDLYVRPPVGFDTPGVVIAMSDGEGGFAAPTFFGSGHFVPGSATDYDARISNLRLFDADDDGDTDIAFDYTVQDFDTSEYYAGVAVHLGNGNGTFEDAQTLQLYNGTDSPVEMFHVGMVADADADGHPELFVLSRSGRFNQSLSDFEADLSVARGNGDGTFAAPQAVDIGDVALTTLPFGSSYAPLTLADMDGDDSLDLVMLGAGTGGTRVGIALGDGQGAFAETASTAFASYFAPGSGLGVADFNGDDQLDVAIGSVIGASASGITFGNGDGTLQAVTDANAGGLRANELIYVNVGGPTIARDFDGDGDPDVLSGSTLLLSTGETTAPPDFTPSASSLAGTASAGDSVETTLAFTASGGFTGDVSFSCRGLPAGASCAFNPSTVSVGSSPVSTTLTISTTERTAVSISPMDRDPVQPWFPGGVLLAGVFVPVIAHRRRTQSRSAVLRLMLALMAGALLFACGGGGGDDDDPNPPPASGTPSGEYSITIDATSGSATHSLVYELTVS